MEILILVLTILAGCLMPVQPSINAVAAQWLASPYLASFFSFLVGTVALGGICVLVRSGWPEMRVFSQMPWWIWSAGIMGAFFVTMTLVAVPRLGAMTVMAVLIAGQMAVSLIMDHYGWFGIQAQPITFWRILGGVLLLSGVVLIRKF